MSLRIVRRTDVQKILGVSRSTTYDRQRAGLLPPPINLGGRAVGWLLLEINELAWAFINGWPEDKIKALVLMFIEVRKMDVKNVQ